MTRIQYSDAAVGTFVRVLLEKKPSFGYESTTPRVGELARISTVLKSQYHVLEVLSDEKIVAKYQYPTRAEECYELLSDDEEEKIRDAWIECQKKIATKRGLTKGQGIFIGSDPEVFVLDENKTVIPAWKFLPHPEKRGTSPAFWDGFQAEFVTKENSCHAYLVDSIRAGLQAVRNAAVSLYPKARLTHKCVVDVPQEMMEEASDGHAALGCAPSKNIYGTPQLDVPAPRNLPFRFAGCHVHQGWGKMDPRTFAETIKAMDAICGVATVSLFQGMEDDRRRKFYGRAGEYRLPPWGLEWRTPSSAALCHPAATHLVFDLARSAAYLGKNLQRCLWNASEEKVQEVINECDVRGARKMLKDNDSIFMALLKGIYGDTSREKPAHVLWTTGVKEHLEVDNMEKVWLLNTNTQEWYSHSESNDCCVGKLKVGPILDSIK